MNYFLPYDLLSDGLKRLIFLFSALLSNQNSTLIFEEPESHLFPSYILILAEQIAFDSSNRYILSTHNPFFLTSLLEKIKLTDLALFLAYYKDSQTMVKLINNDEIKEILSLDEDLFFNLNQFVE